MLLVAFGISLYVSHADDQKRKIVEFATQQSLNLDQLLWENDGAGAARVIDFLAAQADILNVRLFDDSGRLIHASGDFESTVASSI